MSSTAPFETHKTTTISDKHRFEGIVRPYSQADVLKLRGSIKVAHTLAELGARRLWELLNTEEYINALGAMTGLELEPAPPVSATDMLGAIVASVLAGRAEGDDVALVLDSDMVVEGEDCSISFLLVPSRGGVEELLSRLGLGS